MSRFDVIVIGAGAAGMMCAAQAGKRSRKVLVIDHAEKVGKKILISGGGRCNFTNIGADPTHYVSQNPHFCKSALSQYTPEDFIQLVQKYEIDYYEKKLGQLFCTESAAQIVNLLIEECNLSKVQFQLNTKVKNIQKFDSVFSVTTDQGNFSSSSVVIATGGLSIPKIGATDLGYRIAKQFGLNIISPAPALDGFVFSEEDQKQFQELAGISAHARVTCGKHSFLENILFTHAGLSGPASLQSSLYWIKGDELTIDFSPEKNLSEWFLEEKKLGKKTEIHNLLSSVLVNRLAEKLCLLEGVHGASLQQLSNDKISQFADNLHHWKLVPEETVGYQKAEVTRGGVDTAELSSKTMESKKIPGLYFIGEVVDVTGELGGYNFQWAWASGWVAGQYC